MATLLAACALASSAALMAASPMAQAATRPLTPTSNIHYANPAAIKNPVLRRDLLLMIHWSQVHKRPVPVYVRLGKVGHHADARNAAGDPCTTFYAEADVVTGIADLKVAWLQMYTYFCYTGPPIGPPTPTDRVTSHSTWIKIGVTGPGQMFGWSYVQNVTGIKFNCFTASGATNACSGNHEYDQVEFDQCVLKYGCVSYAYPTMDEYEYWNGNYSASPGNVDLV